MVVDKNMRRILFIGSSPVLASVEQLYPYDTQSDMLAKVSQQANPTPDELKQKLVRGRRDRQLCLQ